MESIAYNISPLSVVMEQLTAKLSPINVIYIRVLQGIAQFTAWAQVNICYGFILGSYSIPGIGFPPSLTEFFNF